MKKIISIFLSLTLAAGFVACGGKANSRWQEQYDLGVRYLSEMDYENAIIAFNAAIKIDPKQAAAYISLADVYSAKDEKTKAVETLKQAAALTDDTEIKNELAGYKGEIKENLSDGGYQTNIYDENGNSLEGYKYDRDGNMLRSWVNEYDENGYQIKETTYDSAGNITEYWVWENNEAGQTVKKLYYTGDTYDGYWTYEYDSQGLNSYKRYYKADDSLWQDCHYEYGAGGEKLKETWKHYYSGGQTTVDEYDTKGNWIKRTVYTPDGSLSYSSVFEYDANNNPLKTTHYESDGSYIYETYELDANGNVINTTRYNSDGEVIS